MASSSQNSLPEAGIGAEAPVNPTTSVSVTPPGDGNMAPSLMSGRDDPDSESGSIENPGENDNVPDEAFSSYSDSVVGSKSQPLEILSKIKKLQDELVKVESSARLGQTLENMESLWNREFERLGSDAERQGWSRLQQQRAQSYIKDTTAFAVGREWVHGSEESFVWNLLEREEQEKRLIERREQWEAQKGIAQPTVNNPVEPARLQSNARVGPQPLSHFSAFLDPTSAESRFNSTASAQAYDSRERQLRAQIHETVRQKHDAFLQWRFRPPPPPGKPNLNLIDVWPRPVASYVQWRQFKYYSPNAAFESEARKNLVAIDVLDGEPDPSIPRQSYEDFFAAVHNDEKRMPAGVPKMAQGLVPERIRLNGPQFSQTFRALGCDHYSSDRTQLVVLQPYRLLVYYEKDIRKRHADLKEKLKGSSDQKDESYASKPPEPGYRETSYSSAEQESNASTDTGAESDNQTRDITQNHEVEVIQRRPEDTNSEVSEDSEETKFPLASTETALAYLECLIDFMDTTVSIRRNYVQGSECRKIRFRDLWYLFGPGDEVVSQDEKQVYRVIEVTNPTHSASSKNIFFDLDDGDHSRYFQVSCVYVDFDGKKIGPVSTKFMIKEFAGERSVESLEIYPLRLHRFAADHERKDEPMSSGPHTLRQQLIKRGRKFFQAACMKLENTFYDGPTMDGDDVESQVVVDFETALSSGHQAPELESLLSDADDSSEAISQMGGFVGAAVRCFAACCDSDYVCNDSFVDEKRKEEYIDSLIPQNTYVKLPSVAIYPRTLDDTTGDNALTDDELLLMNYRVFAFVLRTRKWGELGSFVPSNFFRYVETVVYNLRRVYSIRPYGVETESIVQTLEATVFD